MKFVNRMYVKVFYHFQIIKEISIYLFIYLFIYFASPGSYVYKKTLKTITKPGRDTTTVRTNYCGPKYMHWINMINRVLIKHDAVHVTESKNLVSSPCYEYRSLGKKFRVSRASRTNEVPRKGCGKKLFAWTETHASLKTACNSESIHNLPSHFIPHSSFYNYYHSLTDCGVVLSLCRLRNRFSTFLLFKNTRDTNKSPSKG